AAAFTFFVTGQLPYYPIGWQLLLTLAVGGLWLLSARWSMVLALASYFLPLYYNLVMRQDPAFEAAIPLAVAAVLVHLMFFLNPYSFLVIAGATVLFTQPQFAWLLLFAPLALGFLGAARGAFAAALAAFWLEVLLLVGGRADLGLLGGGSDGAPLLQRQGAPV